MTDVRTEQKHNPSHDLSGNNSEKDDETTRAPSPVGEQNEKSLVPGQHGRNGCTCLPWQRFKYP
jgi:hypothetical protein